MKIGIIGPSFGYGGANMVAAEVGKALGQKHEVTFFPYLDEQNYAAIPNEQLASIVEPRNFWQQKIVKIKKGIELSIKHQLTPAKYVAAEFQRLKKLIQRKELEVIILNSYVAIVRFAARIRAAFPEIKLIAWLHEDPDYAAEVTKNYRKFFEDSLRIVDQIICLSQKALRVYQKINPKTEIIYNPLILKTMGRSDLNRPVISFTTRLDIEVKGLDLLCAVAKKIPEPWVIRVAGQGTKKEEIAFKELIKRADVVEKIDFVGPLSGEKLGVHYINSSIFLSTSRTEALPLVMIEALSFGLPIISFDHSGAKELLEDGDVGILIPDLNIEAMEKAINQLINESAKRLEWQKKSLARAKDFELTTVMKKWDRVLNKWREKDD